MPSVFEDHLLAALVLAGDRGRSEPGKSKGRDVDRLL